MEEAQLRSVKLLSLDPELHLDGSADTICTQVFSNTNTTTHVFLVCGRLDAVTGWLYCSHVIPITMGFVAEEEQQSFCTECVLVREVKLKQNLYKMFYSYAHLSSHLSVRDGLSCSSQTSKLKVRLDTYMSLPALKCYPPRAWITCVGAWINWINDLEIILSEHIVVVGIGLTVSDVLRSPFPRHLTASNIETVFLNESSVLLFESRNAAIC